MFNKYYDESRELWVVNDLDYQIEYTFTCKIAAEVAFRSFSLGRVIGGASWVH